MLTIYLKIYSEKFVEAFVPGGRTKGNLPQGGWRAGQSAKHLTA